eukprot:TRINITY_DN44429_c0_g1_i1.p1 TRINITY_DN44429_c0_g1~~TRINITY_DN44429_c0_g1_i1.p1  ORF type:complete len:236 (+),score=42.80 TRINITY_DN44429_c0_g1_i1:157-864(+)
MMESFPVSGLPTNAAINVVRPALPAAAPSAPTPQDVLGPFYVLGAPFRAKLTPPGTEGEHILISGRVLDAESGEPLPFTVMDLWQADPADANYDFYFGDGKPEVYHPRDDPKIIQGETGGRAKDYKFRTRLITDHTGHYEVETVKPPPYFDPDDVCECTESCLCAWRCPHVHVFAQPTVAGSAQLITQLYFEGSQYNDTDKHFNEQTVIRIEKLEGESFQRGYFDIALPRVADTQ